MGANASGRPQEWSVDGMDCAGCARKIQNAVERLPGVEDVEVGMLAKKLSLRLTEEGDRDAVEATVRRLGYAVAPRNTRPHADRGRGADTSDGGGNGPSGVGPAKEPRWYQTPRGRLVVGTGALLSVAWAVKLGGSENLGYYVFAAACLIALVPIAGRAMAALRMGQPFTIETLMTLAAGGALVIGAVEEAALVIFLFAVGEVLEGVAADRARAGIRALVDLVPKTALVIENGATHEVGAADLRIGQRVLVRPGDRVPADGEIVEGSSSLDESPVTGESVPAAKGPGEEVFAGAINAEAALHARVTRAPEDNTIARIIRLVEEAEAARAPTERFIDRFSRLYMPAVVALAALTAVGPPLLSGAEWQVWIYRGLALLLIGCPCALVISVPASIASALSAGARSGLLMKGGAVIEAAARITRVAFDKTGTLTRGRPTVTDVVALGGTEAETLALAAAVEAGSSHPLAEAVLARAETAGIERPAPSQAKAIPGRGAEAMVLGACVVVGSPALAAEQGALTEEAKARAVALAADGKTVVTVVREGTLLGLLAFRDEPRADAAEGIADLKALGITSVMLTGDNARTASAIADGLEMEHRAGLVPEAKVAAIRAMAARESVMMVGDGINDAPALASAQVGVAMGSGSDVALETADGALMRDRVGDVAAWIRLARAAMSNIRQNIAMALGLKAVFLITTIAGITGLWPAILADTGATVLVTLNALRLLSFRPNGGDAGPRPAPGRATDSGTRGTSEDTGEQDRPMP